MAEWSIAVNMANRWTMEEESFYRKELLHLYTKQNKTIGEISALLGIAPQTVFQRLQRLDIPSYRERKVRYCDRRNDIRIPTSRTKLLAEFYGIMLGDGSLSHYQVQVTLGSKEESYAKYVVLLIEKLFGATPKIAVRKRGYRDVYLGSVLLTEWLRENGLVMHKVRSQVGVPEWIFTRKEYMMAFVRGLFDTDGTVYKLRHGMQIAFTNKSVPLLTALHNMLLQLEYKPSRISSDKVYITDRKQLARFFRTIQPQNKKHVERYRMLTGSK